MPYPNLKHWTVALENAALHLLAGRPEVPDHNLYRLHAEPCCKHGEMCVRVIHGALIDHYRWVLTDPAQLAEHLLQAMLPSERVRVHQVAG